MSGRKKFEKYKKFIIFLMDIFPKSFLNILNQFFYGGNNRFSLLIRFIINKKLMNQCGDAAYFGKFVTIKSPELISIGSNFSMHEYCYMDGVGTIKIGSNVSIAHNCSLVSFEHSWEIRDIPIKYNPIIKLPIVICDDVWIGCGVRVLAGSFIESRVVVAAGSVVKGRLATGYLYAGVPAKQIKKLLPDSPA